MGAFKILPGKEKRMDFARSRQPDINTDSRARGIFPCAAGPFFSRCKLHRKQMESLCILWRRYEWIIPRF